ncbi:uncharacterized protein LOC123523795 [Mercenaria mercenaria]|uniref:uncharacterized protein LOC123523795 n=1 Tax=Mercenaria mercenaria TaxID=6596 RepID=UPI00234F0826|nr:uncharacterized protein LOC123523795 [Mercenaria mercenaria]
MKETFQNSNENFVESINTESVVQIENNGLINENMSGVDTEIYDNNMENVKAPENNLEDDNKVGQKHDSTLQNGTDLNTTDNRNVGNFLEEEVNKPLSNCPRIFKDESRMGKDNEAFTNSSQDIHDNCASIQNVDTDELNKNYLSPNGHESLSTETFEDVVNVVTNKDSVNSVENEDVPTYLPQQVRSRRRAKIGSEDLITNDDLLLAATLVANAMQGHKFDVKREPRYVRSYNLFKSIYLRLPLYVAIIVTLVLAVFEEPAVPGLDLPYWVTMSVETTCLLFFIFRICHHAHWRIPRDFKKDLKMIIAIACIIITALDMIAYVLVIQFTGSKAVRWSRSLRPLLIMNFSDGTHLKRAWANIRMTLKQIVHVIVLFYFLIVVFSLVAMKMFQYRGDMKFPDGSEYFKNYLESFWQLYILVTTANNPDVMMPAYDKNRWYCLFFTVYIILCLYLMLNILLAVTYNSYRENMKDQIKHSAHMKRKILHQAFEVIKINVDGNEMVTYKTWKRLIRLAHPGKTNHQIDLLMMVLDTDRSGFISRQQFLNIADLLNVPISVVSERKNFMELHFKKIYKSKLSKNLRKMVDSIYFSLAYDGIVAINVVLLCLNVDDADWFFLALYVLEIALKWYTFGTKRYFYNFQNWTDVIITILSLVVLVVTETGTAGSTNSEILSVLNVFRIFRILRCLIEFERFRIIFDAVFNVSFSIFTYCGILFIVFYCFAIIGMEIFAGKIEFLGDAPNATERAVYCDNPALNGSLFTANGYCKINFNDILNSFVVLASLLIGNNWHDILFM